MNVDTVVGQVIDGKIVQIHDLSYLGQWQTIDYDETTLVITTEKAPFLIDARSFLQGTDWGYFLLEERSRLGFRTEEVPTYFYELLTELLREEWRILLYDVDTEGFYCSLSTETKYRVVHSAR